MRPGYDEAPVNPLPPVVWLIVLPLVAIEAWINAGILGLAGGQEGIGWRNGAAQRWTLGAMYQTETDSTFEDGKLSVNFEAMPGLGQAVRYDAEMNGFTFAAQAW